MAIIGKADTPEERAEVILKEVSKHIGTSYTGDSMSFLAETLAGVGGGTVRWFATLTDRDAYFDAEPGRLRDGISVGVGNPPAGYIYDGTQWLSGMLTLRGPAGQDGADGTDGINGINGTNGTSPFIGPGGFWYAEGVSTGILAQGPAGDTPEIGANGNWKIGAQDTGIKAQGAKGADGAGVVAGGTAGQVLMKLTAADYDTTWGNPPSGGGGALPAGGTAGQVLTKNSTLEGDATWRTPSIAAGTITDVQVDGVSAVSGTVANLTGLASDAELSNAISGEVSARNAAITAAIGVEVTQRDSAIAAASVTDKAYADSAVLAEVSARNTAISGAITAEVTARNTAISDAITEEIIDRDDAIETAVDTLETTLTGLITEETTNRADADALLLPKAGGTMTGPLTLSGAPTVDNGASTKKYVDDQITAIQSSALVFKCFVSTTTPAADVAEGNYWYQPSSALATPDLTFPWQVKTYASGAWSASTSLWTPSAFDVVTNLDAAGSGGVEDLVQSQFIMDLSSQCNGTTKTFTLTETVTNSLLVYNGMILHYGATNDYTISGTTLTYNGIEAPIVGDVLWLSYWK